MLLGLQGGTCFFHYSADNDSLEPAEEDLELADRATAYYQTAFVVYIPSLRVIDEQGFRFEILTAAVPDRGGQLLIHTH